jgi:hypothetical protein
VSYRPDNPEDLLRQVERWTPAEAEVWSRWRKGLGPGAGGDLLALQAVLSGLVAFRRLESPRDGAAPMDLRPHLHAVHAAYDWAIQLIGRLQAGQRREPGRKDPRAQQAEPESSLCALELALRESLTASEQALQLPVVDARAFEENTDRFLRTLERNRFFGPPGPLEFCNASELVPPQTLGPKLASWRSEAAKTTLLISLLTLLRTHRFLGIADRQIGGPQGLHRAYVVIAGVRRELRTWSRFVSVQAVETFAEELEARLLSVDATGLLRARADLSHASRRLQRLRQSAEAVAADVHAKSCTALEQPPAAPDGAPNDVLSAERVRNGIRIVRQALKEAAKDLYRSASASGTERPARARRPVERDLHRDIWAFRFILRAFVAKSSVAPLAADDWYQAEDLEFVSEFVGHFRVFGPRLARSTEYARRGPLMQSVEALSKPDFVDATALRLATYQCALFADHLDAALGRIPRSPLAPFDKHKAAAELRGYLTAAKDRTSIDRAAAAAFGSSGAPRMQAG